VDQVVVAKADTHKKIGGLLKPTSKPTTWNLKIKGSKEPKEGALLSGFRTGRRFSAAMPVVCGYAEKIPQ
jgi:hypothetical protein